MANETLDNDLEQLAREDIVAEVKRLRAGIRRHRDSTGHDLCWHHPELWNLLPEKAAPELTVPEWPQFLRGCLRYRESLDVQLPHAPRVTPEFEVPAGPDDSANAGKFDQAPVHRRDGTAESPGGRGCLEHAGS
jgi:hypothetical protein